MTLTKKSQHRRSVETLGLSGNDDECILTQIQMLINYHAHKPPYTRNTLERIQILIDTHFANPNQKE